MQAEVRGGKPFFRVKVKVEAGVIQLMHRGKHPREWHKLSQDGKLLLNSESLQSVEVEVEISNAGKSGLTPF